MGFLDTLIQRLVDWTKRHYLEHKYGALWPYPEAAGVGLRITGLRDADRFLEAILMNGCPPAMATALKDRLVEHGEIKTTISHQVDLLAAIDAIGRAGSVVQVIAPAQRYLSGSNKNFDQ